MRINKFIATATGLSRRRADELIDNGEILVNDQLAKPGVDIVDTDKVTWGDKVLTQPVQHETILLNKPVGYVCSRNGQGSQTIYDLLPEKYRSLKPVGRLDKDSSGLLLLTTDGELANRLTHPSFQKEKVYEIELNKIISNTDKEAVQRGVELEDGVSKLQISCSDNKCTVKMREGRNRQIRRTFDTLGYTVTRLHRTQFGDYSIGEIKIGSFTNI